MTYEQYTDFVQDKWHKAMLRSIEEDKRERVCCPEVRSVPYVYEPPTPEEQERFRQCYERDRTLAKEYAHLSGKVPYRGAVVR